MTTASSDAVLAVLESVDAESSEQLVDFVVRTPDISGCYVFLKGSARASTLCPPGEPRSSSNSSSSSSSSVTAGQVNGVACLLDAFAVSDRPRMHCVPLLESAGWTLDRVAALPLIRVLLLLLLPPALRGSNTRGESVPGAADTTPLDGSGSRSPAAASCAPSAAATTAAATALPPVAAAGSSCGAAPNSAESIGRELERLRPDSLPRWVTRSVAAALHPDRGGCGGGRECGGDEEEGRDSRDAGGGGAPRSSQRSDETAGPRPLARPYLEQRYVTLVDGVAAPPDAPLRFGRVAVGGTFDRLHAGHELLLAVTALVADGFVFVGVTADALLANKSHRELLQPYDARAAVAVSYMQQVRPGLQVEAGPLSDPKAPTLAELDPDMEALVVSVETLPGAAAINAGRRARGFRPLTVITVPVIGLRGGGSSGAGGRDAAAPATGFASKLSSSGLRALEAAAVVTPLE